MAVVVLFIKQLTTVGQIAVANELVAVGFDVDKFGEVDFDIVFEGPDGVWVILADAPIG